MTLRPLEWPVDEGLRVCAAARTQGIDLRILGGVAVWVHCDGSQHLLTSRDYGDVDFMGPASSADRLDGFFQDLGYEPNWTFNRLHKGDGRLMFLDQHNGRRVDVFLDRFSMCHSLDLSDRLDLDFPTLSLADLALTKLQVFQVTAKDLLDLQALLGEHPIGQGNTETVDVGRITSVCSSDWGWYRTVRGNLERLAAGDDPAAAGHATELLQHIEGSPKTRRWKLRAVVGDRVPWYQLPEEV